MGWEQRVEKLGKVIWSQFFTKVLQMTILVINWNKNKCQYSKENSSLEQRTYLHNKMQDLNQNTSKRKEEKF